MSLPAEFHEIAKRVNNWGRWGEDDEMGTLSLINDEVVKDATATVHSGRRVALALPLQQDGIQTGIILGRVNPLHTMVQINQELFGPGTVATSDDAVTMGLQAATHWDAAPIAFEIFPPEIENLWLPVHALDLVAPARSRSTAR